MRAAAIALAMLALGALGAAGLSAAGSRARHLALPVLADPSLPPPAPSPLPEAPPCALRELGRVPARPTALLRARDGLWVGTFDQGVWRIAGDAAQEVPGLEGRERFVNSLGQLDGLVWAGTQRGAIGFDGGARAYTALGDAAVTALAPAPGVLVAGTSRGVALLSRLGTRSVALEGAGAEPRVTSLAVGAETLWVGTADGVFAAPLEAVLRGAAAARSIPLVFGDPPARTNVVVALAPLGARAAAGTDDGGVALVSPDGGVSALRLSPARANEVNPGAAAAAADLIAFGTQGAGLLLARDDGGRLAAATPAGFPSASVSALAPDGDALLAATAEGRVLEVRCRGLVAAR